MKEFYLDEEFGVNLFGKKVSFVFTLEWSGMYLFGFDFGFGFKMNYFEVHFKIGKLWVSFRIQAY